MEPKRKESLKEINERWLATRTVDSAAHPVLLIDDSESDIFFLLRAFQWAGVRNPIAVVRNGEEALKYITGEGAYGDRERYPVPHIIFLDLYMPVVNGFQVLEMQRNNPEYRNALWIALSSSERINDVNRAYKLGVSTFLSKPLNSDDVRNLLEAYKDFWTVLRSPSSIPPGAKGERAAKKKAAPKLPH